MATVVRVSETQVESKVLEIKCPFCGVKSKTEITEEQAEDILDGSDYKWFCPKCTEAIDIELKY